MSSLKGQPCSHDLDCIAGLLCFPNVTQWVQQEFGTSTCWCNGLKSFVGDNCDEDHPSRNLMAMFEAITLTGGILFILTASWCLLGLYRVSKQNKNEVTLTTPLVQTAILVLLLGIMNTITNSQNITCTTTTQWVYVPGKGKICPYEISTIVTSILSLLFGFLALLNVSVAWISIILNVKQFRSDSRSSGIMRRLVIAVRILEFAFLVAVATAMGDLNASLAIILLLPFGLILIISYSVAGVYLSKLLIQAGLFERNYGSPNVARTNTGSDESAPDQFRRGVQRVQWTMRGVVICMSSLIILAGAGALLATKTAGGTLMYEKGGWDRPGTFLTSAGLNCGVFAELCVTWFVFISARNKILKLSKKRETGISSTMVGVAGIDNNNSKGVPVKESEKVVSQGV